MVTTMRVVGLCVLTVVCVSSALAQSPAPGATTQAQEPTLPTELRLERDNMLLQSRVTELEVQLAAMKAQLVQVRLGELVPSIVQRLQAAAPEYDVDPQTLQLTRKKTAGTAPAPAAAPPPTSPPASATPQQR